MGRGLRPRIGPRIFADKNRETWSSFLVPKLRLGTLFSKLRFDSTSETEFRGGACPNGVWARRQSLSILSARIRVTTAYEVRGPSIRHAGIFHDFTLRILYVHRHEFAAGGHP